MRCHSSLLQAWAIFRAFEKHCRVDSGGYAGLESVLGRAPFKRRDHMESFWLSESLKYLWLLFSDDGADLQLPAPDIVCGSDTSLQRHVPLLRKSALTLTRKEQSQARGHWQFAQGTLAVFQTVMCL